MIISQTNRKTVYFSQFIGKDMEERVEKAFSYLREHPYTTMIIEQGNYVITSELARWTLHAVMNGELGDNPSNVMFKPGFAYSRGLDFAGQKGTRILGYGVTLMIDGFMEPISLNHCEDIELCGLTIDHLRKPYCHGTVTHIDYPNEEEMILSIEFPPDCPVTELTPIQRQRYYDPVADSYTDIGRPSKREHIDTCHCRMHYIKNDAIHVGMEFYGIHTYHFRPAILIEHAKNITLTDITIHSQPGMGIVGNRSEEVLIRRLAVVPSVGQHWSTNTDATHFTSMKGTLRLENCISEGHGDDFTNVHVYFQEVVDRETDTVCYIQEKTPEGTHAVSLDYPDVGDHMELTDKNTLQTIDTYQVLDCEPMPEKWMCKITLDHPLPEDTSGLVLADVTRLPRLEVVGCTITSHYARSILVKTRNVLIERNFFKNALGMAIEIAAEAWWYEGVCPSDVLIRNNRIVNCGCREAAGVVVKADAQQASGQSIYRVTIEDNIIDVPFAAHAIYVRNVAGLQVYRNHCNCYDQAVIIRDCVNVSTDILQ